MSLRSLPAEQEISMVGYPRIAILLVGAMEWHA